MELDTDLRRGAALGFLGSRLLGLGSQADCRLAVSFGDWAWCSRLPRALRVRVVYGRSTGIRLPRHSAAFSGFPQAS
jgi:hypothetical protein